jgi:c-di-GMP-binding flagellar brake protein YcgR
MIDILDVVRPGDRVDLEMISVDGEGREEKKYHITKVYDISDDAIVEVVMPQEQGRTIIMSQSAQ